MGSAGGPGMNSRQRVLLLELMRHPHEFFERLLQSEPLAECRAALEEKGYHQLPGGAMVFVEPFQFVCVVNAAMSHCHGNLRPYHVIVSERFQPFIEEVINMIPSRANVRIRR